MGIDLVAVDSVRDALAVHGERYLARVYTEREVEDCRGDGAPDAERLAARFAAKEATFKALRAGNRPVAWRDVETVRNPDGWVEVNLTGAAADMAAGAGITELALSITHEGGFAAAVVIAEIPQRADR